MPADNVAHRSGSAPAGLNPSSHARGLRCGCSSIGFGRTAASSDTARRAGLPQGSSHNFGGSQDMYNWRNWITPRLAAGNSAARMSLPAVELADRGGDVRILRRPVEPVAGQQGGAIDDLPINVSHTECNDLRDNHLCIGSGGDWPLTSTLASPDNLRQHDTGPTVGANLGTSGDKSPKLFRSKDDR